MPAALLSKISIFPSLETVSETIDSTWSGSLTSQEIAKTFPPCLLNSFAVSSITFWRRLVITRSAPNSAKRVAMDLPNPVPPPVTTIFFPFNN